MTGGGHVTESSLVDELRAGRSVTYFTRGVSMRPLLRTAETHVHIRPVSGAEKYLHHGIVLYVRANGQLILHRLIKQAGDLCYMRGDNTYGLEPIPRSHVIGVVDLIWRDGGYIDVLTDRKYLRYVRRRLWNYPLRCAVHYPCMWARAAVRRILKGKKSA